MQLRGLLHSVPTSSSLARLEAIVYDRDPADGGKRLGKGRRQVFANDFRDYVEKAETQAIGRALAVAGFGTQFCDDLDEDDNISDSPVTNIKVVHGSESNKPQNNSCNQIKRQVTKRQPATETNTSLLYKVASQKGFSQEDTDLIVMFKYQKNNASELDDEELTEMVEGIQKTSKERLHDFVARFGASLEEQNGVA